MTLSSKGRRKPQDTEILLLVTWQKGAWPRNTSHRKARMGTSHRRAGDSPRSKASNGSQTPGLGVCENLEFAHHGVTLAKNAIMRTWPRGDCGGTSVIS